MNKLLLPLVLTFTPMAYANDSIGPATSVDIELKSFIQTNSGSKDYKWKSSTICTNKRMGKDPAKKNSANVIFYVCPDKTLSHIQPESTGVKGWEGYCGQTAISNVTSMLCERHISPKENDNYGTDVSPGQHSSTMRKVLRKIFTESPQTNTCPKVTWNTRATWSGSAFLKKVKGDLFGSSHKMKRFRSANTYVNVTPTPVLLNSGGLNYHWVTVVDVINNNDDYYGCDVVLNTWGDQKILTCENFVHYGNHSSLGEHVNLGFD